MISHVCGFLRTRVVQGVLDLILGVRRALFREVICLSIGSGYLLDGGKGEQRSFATLKKSQAPEPLHWAEGALRFLTRRPLDKSGPASNPMFALGNRRLHASR